MLVDTIKIADACGVSVVAGLPECAVDRVDGLGGHLDCWKQTVNLVDHLLAEDAAGFQSAAGESCSQSRAEIGIESVHFVEREDDIGGQQTASFEQYLDARGISGFRAFVHHGSKPRKIGRGKGFYSFDDPPDAVNLPLPAEAFEQERSFTSVIGPHGCAEALVPDPVAGSLIGEAGAPSANVDHFSSAGPRYGVGTRAGDDQQAAPTRKGGFHGDLIIAAEDQLAAYPLAQRLPQPGSHRWVRIPGAPDAARGHLIERDPRLGLRFAEQGVERLERLVPGDAGDFDASTFGSGENFAVCRQRAACAGSPGVNGQVDWHGKIIAAAIGIV